MKFNHIVCGGTFDHFHKGHKKLLNKCAIHGKRVTVGVTVGAMTRHKLFSQSIEPYAKRAAYITQFNPSFSLFKLSDIFGPTLTDPSIDAICVTKDTLKGANLINIEREKSGMKPLSIILVPFEYDDMGEVLSSERVRSGVVNREGESYYKFLIGTEIRYLPESLREELRSPLGRVISSLEDISSHQLAQMKAVEKKSFGVGLISVGDVITLNLKKVNIYPHLSIIDGRTHRKALDAHIINTILNKERIEAPNEKGTIQIEAVKALYELFVSGHRGATKQLYITGEEDLLTLVAVLFAPLNTHVWYGQQGVGAVDIQVTEKMKERVYNLVKRFK
jgi:cytidyltransferase-like protein